RFFFQAEDGIRDCHVTGVQTCALPILALAQELTADAGMAAVPVVLLLPADHGVPVDALAAAGVQRCLRKPVAYARLREAVASACVPRSARARPEPRPAGAVAAEAGRKLRVLVVEDNP